MYKHVIFSNNWLAMVNYKNSWFKIQNEKVPSLICMPSIHTLLNEFANFTKSTRLGSRFNPSNVVKT